MKKHLFLFAGLCLVSLFSLAQSTNLVIFSEESEPFYVFVNGVKQNSHAETNVKVTGITQNVSLRIEFENKALPKLTKTMSLEPGFEHTARIKKDKKTQAVKLQYFGQVPIAESTAADVPTVIYHTAEEPAVTETNSAGQNAGSMSTTSTTTSTQMNSAIDNSGTMAVNMNTPGVGITMIVPGMTSTMQTSTSSTVTQSSSNTGSINNNSSNTTQVTSTTTAPVKTGCSVAMTTANFNAMKKSVESKPFSDTKMSTAKVATKNACLSVAQVKEITKLFAMDEDKLAYAKYAYDYCVDKANYYQVSEVFSFSGTTDEFNKFLEK